MGDGDVSMLGEGSAKNSVSAPLMGIKVLEIGHIISGPFSTLMLAGLGAEVVKIERPDHGDELRSVGRYKGRETHEDYFNANNYGKKSVALDLKSPAGVKLALELATKADVLVENLSPGTMARLGLGWADVSQVNPKIVYCSISGFGQSGPYRSRPAVDVVIQAVSGAMSVTGQSDGPPTQIGAPLADVTTSMCAATAILGALYAVRCDGIGRYIDISMQEAFVYALSPRLGGVLQTGDSPSRIGNQNPMRVPSDVYTTKDGVSVFIMVTNDRSWGPFCRALKRDEWASHPRFATNRLRTQHRDEINQLTHLAVSQFDSEELLEQLEANRVCFSRVNNYAEAVRDPNLLARGLIHQVKHITSGSVKVVGPPWEINGSRSPVAPPPALGQHTDRVVEEWLGKRASPERC